MEALRCSVEWKLIDVNSSLAGLLRRFGDWKGSASSNKRRCRFHVPRFEDLAFAIGVVFDSSALSKLSDSETMFIVRAICSSVAASFEPRFSTTFGPSYRCSSSSGSTRSTVASFAETLASTSKAFVPNAFPLKSSLRRTQHLENDCKKASHRFTSDGVSTMIALLERSRSLRFGRTRSMIGVRRCSDCMLRLLSFRHSSSSSTTFPCSPSYWRALIAPSAISMKPSSPSCLDVKSISTTGSLKAAFEPDPGGMRLILRIVSFHFPGV